MPPPPGDDEVPQVGRRPSSPGFLLLLGVIWVVCGIVALVSLDAGWKLIPGIVFIGIGLLFVRGGVTAFARHDRDS